jgi:hypothetical protein
MRETISARAKWPSRIRRGGFGGRNHLVHVDAAQVEQTADGIVDQIVRTGSARRDPNVDVS